MFELFINEIRKIRRSDVLLIFSLVWLFTDVLAAFQLFSGQDNTLNAYGDFTNTIIWDSFSMVLPAMLLIFSNYLINLEDLAGTLKNTLTIPVSITKLYTCKIFTVGIINIAFAVMNAVLSFVIFMFLPHATETWQKSLFSMIQMIGISFGVYIAILPIILIFIRQTNAYLNVILGFVYGFVGIFVAGQNFQDYYPITAFLKVVNYDNGSLIYHGNASYIAIIICLLLTFLIGFIQKYRLEKMDIK